MYREHQSQPLRIDVTFCGMAADVRRGAFVSMHTSRASYGSAKKSLTSLLFPLVIFGYMIILLKQ